MPARAHRRGYAGGVRPGHADARHVFFAYRIDRDRRNQCGIDAAAQTDQHAAKSAFANVIARAQDERIVGSVVGIEIGWANVT